MSGGITSISLSDSRMVTPSRAHANMDAEQKRLMQACEEFESIFVHMLLRSMRKSVPKTGFLHGGSGEDIFQDMLDEQIALEASRSGQFGLAKTMFYQLSRPRWR
ncbi:MAG: rod-binding protein [Bacillota bacterium]|jgi:flagellar protein FlgJ|nr:flagellar biosynthesis protein FlgJ [Bacillota bacterium]HOB91509.1 rod-binding protein [Bacillota bacterium]HPZ54663.1 rod-binding protein [Bacillota bacterium]HQD18901.1 rod-binding protein [Bacillota bacterium]